MPTFRQTPFRAGRLTVAGERGRRAGAGWRALLRTWLRVVEREEEVVKVRCERVVVSGWRRGVERVRDWKARRRECDGSSILLVGGMLSCLVMTVVLMLSL